MFIGHLYIPFVKCLFTLSMHCLSLSYWFCIISLYFLHSSLLWVLSTAIIFSYSMLVNLDCHNTLPWIGWLKPQNGFLTAQRLRSLRSRCPQGSVPGESSLPGSQIATFSMCLHMVERGAASSLEYFLIRALILSWGPHPHNLITSQRPISSTILWNIRKLDFNIGTGGYGVQFSP